MGGAPAETTRGSQDRLKGQPQERQHSAAEGGTRDRLPPASDSRATLQGIGINFAFVILSQCCACRARTDRDHRRSRTCSTRARAAASTPASTITRRFLPTTITICPLVAVAATDGSTSAARTTRAKPVCSPCGLIGSELNERRHVISSERDMPWRLAVDDVARGA